MCLMVHLKSLGWFMYRMLLTYHLQINGFSSGSPYYRTFIIFFNGALPLFLLVVGPYCGTGGGSGRSIKYGGSPVAPMCGRSRPLVLP